MRVVSVALALVLTGCPKQGSVDGTVLSAADLATLQDTRNIVSIAARFPDVADSPYACRAFVHLDFVLSQVEAVGSQLVAAPSCLPAATADATGCPAFLNTSDPLLSQAAADKAVEYAEIAELAVLTIKDAHVGDPVVSAWADLSVQRLSDIGTEVLAELADPDDLIAVPEVCVR